MGSSTAAVVVALVAVSLAHALGILFQLGGVKSLREKILEDDGIGDADGLQVLHRAAQQECVDVLVAAEMNLAHFDGRAFLDVEVHLHRGRRNGLDLGLDGGELVAVLRQNVLEHSLGPLDARGVVLALDGEANLFLLEAVEHVRDRDSVQPLVVDLANGGLFPNKDVQDDALLRVLALNAQIVEVGRIP